MEAFFTSTLGAYTDATAAIGTAQRAGVGRTRHLDFGMLWIQQKEWQRKSQVGKIKGTENAADIFTTNVSEGLLQNHVAAFGFHERSGRVDEAAELSRQG